MTTRTPTRRTWRFIVRCSAAVGLAALAADALAADRSWTNTAGGTFSTAANWQNSLIPGVNDVANFNNSSIFFPPGQTNYTISFAGNTQIQAVKVKNDFVTFNLLGRTFTTTQTTGNEIGTVADGGSIAVARSARLTIQNGTFNFSGLTPQMLIGAVPGGIGTLAIGADGVIAGSPNLFFGTASAAGTLTVNGGTMTVATLSLGSGASGNGTASIVGPFSSVTTTRLLVGDAGAGTMSMITGAIFQNNGSATIGNATNSSGLVTVDGATVRWIQSGTLLLGHQGRGTVNLINGGSLQAGVAILGNSGRTGLLNISGANSRASFGNMTVGNVGTGTINITGGGRLEAGIGTLGASMNGTGVLNVIGPGSHAAFTNLSVGQRLVGSITISGGGSLSCTGTSTTVGAGTGSSGTADVDGVGSRWINSGTLMVGERGDGTMNVSGGGLVQCAAAMLAFGDIKTNVTIHGPGSRWEVSGPLTIAHFGLATLNITNGGVLTSGGGRLGATSIGWGTVLVSGSDSLWTSSGVTHFGAEGLGVMRISSGGTADAPEAHIPDPAEEFGVGLVSVTDPGSRWTVGVLGLGNSIDPLNPVASGRLAISAGGRVEVGQTLNVGDRGKINLDGGTLSVGGSGLTNDGSFRISSSPSHVLGRVTNLSGGTIAIEGTRATFHNEVFNRSEFRVGPAGEAILLGELTGATPGSTIVEAGGSLTAPRIGEQSLTVNGNVNINPGGTDASTSRLNQLSVTGRLDLSNNALLLDYTGPSPINTIRALITSGFAGGSWNGSGINSSTAASTPNRAIGFAEATDIGSPAVFAGQAIDATTVLIRFTLPGDANLDRTVNIADFSLLASNFNLASNRWARGDFNYDGSTGIGDFALLAANFNQTLPADAARPAGAAVPEPAGMVAALGLTLARRSRRRR